MKLQARVLVPAAVIILFLVLSRFIGLNIKPYHHDESLYAVEAWRYATQGLYKFNPMLHGPFLFHVHAALFEILPINDFTGRLPAALFGLGLAFVALPLFRRQGCVSAAVWLALIALSPSFCFFSRFLGMDVPVCFLGVSLLVCLVKWRETSAPKFLYLSAALFAFMVCTKLNFLFYGFSFVTFLPFWLKAEKENGGEPLPDFLKKFQWHWAWAGALFCFIFCALYSSMGTNPGGILDALYRTNIPYWVRQHQTERIGGPFHYYLPFFAIYEAPVVLGLAAAVAGAFISSRQTRKEMQIWFFAAVGAYVLSSSFWPSIGAAMNVFHMREAFHPALLAAEIGIWAVLVRHHLRRNERFSAFCAHWGITSLLLYSYAGEKIPWLTVHMLLPWHLYLAATLPALAAPLMNRRLPRAALGFFLVAVFAWQAAVTVRSSFDLSANPRERLVYTHTSWEITDLVDRVRHLGRTLHLENRLPIQVTGNAVWPLHWYFRDHERWYWLDIDPAARPVIAVQDWEKKDQTQTKLGGDYEVERFKLREWWVPDTSRATGSDYFRYYVSREIFSPVGSSDLAVFIRRDALEEWRRFIPEKRKTSTN